MDSQPHDLVGGESARGELGQVLFKVPVTRGVSVQHHGRGSVPRAPHWSQDVFARVLTPTVAQRRLSVPQQLDTFLHKKDS